MEIAKFRLQFSTALEQVKVRLWQVRYRFRKLRRIAAVRAGRLGHKLRPRVKALRMWLAAKSREAIAAAGSKITKARARISTVFEKGTGHLRQVRNRLGQARNRWARLKRGIAEKVHKAAEECCAREDELRAWLAARSRKAIVAANSKITKARARVSIIFKKGFEKGAGHLREAQNRLAGLKGSIAAKRQKLAEERRVRKLQKPPEELRARGHESRPPEARPREAAVAANKIAKVKVQPPAAIEQWTAHLLQAQNPLAGLARSIAEKPPKLAEERPARELQKLPEEPRAREDELRVQVARPREAAIEADSQIAEVKARPPAASGQWTARLRQAQKTLSGLGRNIADRRQTGRQELGARESQMHELLANSRDAIAIINGDHCFVTANRRALDLFGVSERNLSKFSIDAFLFRGQIADLQRNGSSFMGRQEKHGQCLIRRLDGSLRVAEFALVTEFLPLHVYRFYDLCMPRWPTPIQHRIAPETQHGSHAGQAG